MSEAVLENKELERLEEIGEPQGGDDDQMVAFRTTARAMLKMAKAQKDMSVRLKAVEEATEKCEGTHEMVKELVEALAPPGQPESHMSVRVSSLEEKLSGWQGGVSKVVFPVIIAIVIGAMGFAWNATVDAAAAKKAAVEAGKAHGPEKKDGR